MSKNLSGFSSTDLEVEQLKYYDIQAKSYDITSVPSNNKSEFSDFTTINAQTIQPPVGGSLKLQSNDKSKYIKINNDAITSNHAIIITGDIPYSFDVQSLLLTNNQIDTTKQVKFISDYENRRIQFNSSTSQKFIYSTNIIAGNSNTAPINIDLTISSFTSGTMRFGFICVDNLILDEIPNYIKYTGTFDSKYCELTTTTGNIIDTRGIPQNVAVSGWNIQIGSKLKLHQDILSGVNVYTLTINGITRAILLDETKQYRFFVEGKSTFTNTFTVEITGKSELDENGEPQINANIVQCELLRSGTGFLSVQNNTGNSKLFFKSNAEIEATGTLKAPGIETTSLEASNITGTNGTLSALTCSTITSPIPGGFVSINRLSSSVFSCSSEINTPTIGNGSGAITIASSMSALNISCNGVVATSNISSAGIISGTMSIANAGTISSLSSSNASITTLSSTTGTITTLNAPTLTSTTGTITTLNAPTLTATTGTITTMNAPTLTATTGTITTGSISTLSSSNILQLGAGSKPQTNTFFTFVPGSIYKYTPTASEATSGEITLSNSDRRTVFSDVTTVRSVNTQGFLVGSTAFICFKLIERVNSNIEFAINTVSSSNIPVNTYTYSTSHFVRLLSSDGRILKQGGTVLHTASAIQINERVAIYVNNGVIRYYRDNLSNTFTLIYTHTWEGTITDRVAFFIGDGNTQSSYGTVDIDQQTAFEPATFDTSLISVKMDTSGAGLIKNMQPNTGLKLTNYSESSHIQINNNDIAINKNINLTGGIILNSGAVLSTYDYTTQLNAWYDSGNTKLYDCTLILQTIGNRISIQMPSMATTNINNKSLYLQTAIPSIYRPTSKIENNFTVLISTGLIIGEIEINTDGTINIYSSYSGATFTDTTLSIKSQIIAFLK